MAGFEWRRLFGKGAKAGEPSVPVDAPLLAEDTPSAAEPAAAVAAAEDRQNLIREIEGGFRGVAQVVANLDRHLEGHNRLLDTVVAAQDTLPGLVREVTASATAQRLLQETLVQHLAQRDEVSRALLAQLDRFNDGLQRQQADHRAQMELVMRLQRGGRRMLAFLLLMLLGVCSVLFLLLLVVALRPDLIQAVRLPAAQSAPQPTIDRRIEEAARSMDPKVSAAAQRLLRESAGSP